MRIKIYIIFFVVIVCLIKTKGQDIHFSQFNNSFLNLNPANTGTFIGDYRAGVINKNQWQSVTKPYQTLSASFEAKLIPKLDKNFIGAGILLNRDKAGDASYGTTEAAISVSFTRSIGKKTRNFVSLGLQAGFAQKSFNLDKLYFDNNWNGDIFDGTITTNHNIQKDNFTYPDISLGLSWRNFINNGFNAGGGISVYHINQPELSVIEDKSNRLKQRMNIHIDIYKSLSEKVQLLPTVLFSKQGKLSEIIAGSNLRFGLSRKQIAINTGLFSRIGDAIILSAGIEYAGLMGTLSYDLNYSDLKTVSKSKGGFEISVIYIILKQKQGEKYKIPCTRLIANK